MAERAHNQQLGGDNSVEGAPFLGWAEALKADLVAVDVDGFAVPALLDLVAELDALHRSVVVAQEKALARLHASE